MIRWINHTLRQTTQDCLGFAFFSPSYGKNKKKKHWNMIDTTGNRFLSLLAQSIIPTFLPDLFPVPVSFLLTLSLFSSVLVSSFWDDDDGFSTSFIFPVLLTLEVLFILLSSRSSSCFFVLSSCCSLLGVTQVASVEDDTELLESTFSTLVSALWKTMSMSWICHIYPYTY